MALQRGDFPHFWVRPNTYLILRIPMSAHNFVQRFTELKVRNLRTCVYGANDLSSEHISHF